MPNSNRFVIGVEYNGKVRRIAAEHRYVTVEHFKQIVQYQFGIDHSFDLTYANAILNEDDILDNLDLQPTTDIRVRRNNDVSYGQSSIRHTLTAEEFDTSTGLSNVSHIRYNRDHSNKRNANITTSNSTCALSNGSQQTNNTIATSSYSMPTRTHYSSDVNLARHLQKLELNKRESPVIFLSYQWASKGKVKRLKADLEREGFECWMDNGQMGGGDKLFDEIDAGIRQTKVFICCLNEKYPLSDNCCRELNYAITLKKSVIPLLMENITWPPQRLGIILSQYIYIRFHHDPTTDNQNSLEEKFEELLRQICRFIN
ncbi:unnamed protein product [Didymodactylos carnosus]|uniref:TIR domain-containing protein n=1 Tax=Didymodactylos carnosus TaxID=1234261 RepID=A0A814MW69_9BILA|nr:unnamed protein product [Didymodactylos carnosus]CAF1482042.1 unnamed protein product [Didymodactylos carnosus]CAF3850839.1 unnamed protein product [Didymodactylos carnosus]CAF4272479.1 unnamed protein product [Didymodactylos carnosus]